MSDGAAAGGMPQIVYVLSAGHSGSTLLSLLLNAHSRIHALSEIDKLPRLLGTPGGSRRLESPFWRAVRARWEAESGHPLESITPRPPRGAEAGDAELSRWASDYARLARAVAAVAGKPILVDASKDGAQLALLWRSARFDLRVVELLRDGRGVVSSYRRKYHSFARGYRRWAHARREAELLRPRFDAGRWHRLRYEDLARDPERALRGLCAFLDVPFEPGMLAYRSAPWEGVSGNRMALERGEGIALDERWREQMSFPQRALFAALGGWRNARDGY